MQRNSERDRGEKGTITQEDTISGSREEAQERISGLVGEDRQRPLVCKSAFITIVYIDRELHCQLLSCYILSVFIVDI